MYYLNNILLPYRDYTTKKATYMPQKNLRRQSLLTAHRNTNWRRTRPSDL